MEVVENVMLALIEKGSKIKFDEIEGVENLQDLLNIIDFINHNQLLKGLFPVMDASGKITHVYTKDVQLTPKGYMFLSL